MKTIHYQFFIYFFLTIIYGAISTDNKSGTPRHQTNNISDKCNLRILFSSLKTTKDCPRLAVNLAELGDDNVSAYLCTGIVHGVHTICQLNSDNPNTTVMIGKNITELDNEINKLSFNKTISEFCNSMVKSISNSSYIETIKNETDIIKLNGGLNEFCVKMCGNFKKRIQPVCSALLWLNRLLADTEMRVKTVTKKNESAQSLPAPNNSLAKATELKNKEEQASNKAGISNLLVKPLSNDSQKKQEESINTDHGGSKSELGKGSTASKSDNTPEPVLKKKVEDIIKPEIEGGTQEEAPIIIQGPGFEDEAPENDETSILGSQEVDPNQSIGAGNEETDLHESNVPLPNNGGQETRLKAKITHQKEAENEKNDNKVGGGDGNILGDKEDDLGIDSSETGNPLGVNGK